MGPLATYNLYKSIIDNTPVEKDQDHIDMVILNASHIPDRTAGILSGGESPLPYLLDGCRTLEKAGCDAIAVPCNTSHYFYDELVKNCKIKILNMVELTAQRLSEQNIPSVFLMATAGTVKTGIYNKYLTAKNIDMLPPDDGEISVMMKAIYDIKAGLKPDLSDIAIIAEKYRGFGCKKIIFGCTEFSLVKDEIINILSESGNNFSDFFIDSTDVLKDEILKLFLTKCA
jgi:aspartate racemase